MLSKVLLHLATLAIELTVVYYLSHLPCRDVGQEGTCGACCADEQRVRCPVKIEAAGCWLYKRMPLDLSYVVGDVLSVMVRWDPHNEESELMIRLLPNASYNAVSSTVRLHRPPSLLGHDQIVSVRRSDFSAYYAVAVATRPVMSLVEIVSCPGVDSMVAYIDNIHAKLGRRTILQAIYDDSIKRLRSSSIRGPYVDPADAEAFEKEEDGRGSADDKHYAYVGSERTETETQRGALKIPSHMEL
ncbi:ORF208 [Saltwater crocodilepox virus]|nr:ORF208 [Saltwater crocodilepox virus]QGT46863.1 ORF208 [Saltwater crocodilepox virus]QGT47077.1 ORF208 [Saltwater crocodilepox virus]QGT47508.1 ORF208 [Saltwater crocodilepox virus]QGT47722.1 ORF205 [Saltwater crocodilepox virus]